MKTKRLGGKWKVVTTLILFSLFASVASAETYKWEDANGIHFTDNASSVPEKYREKHMPDTKPQSQGVPAGIVQQNRAVVMQPYLPPTIQPTVQQDQAAIYQANLEQQRRVAEVMRQQQARALAASTRNVEKVANSFAKVMAFWLLMGFALIVAWVSTIVDIVRSEFVSPSNKTVWMLLVIFLPLLGMLLYFIFGNSQKCKATNFSKKNNWNASQRDYRRGFQGRDPDIH